MFKGSMVALITPFDNGAVDEDCFSRLVDWQIDALGEASPFRKTADAAACPGLGNDRESS